MSRLVKIAAASDIAEGKALCVEVEGKHIAVFHLDGAFYAIDDACSHVGGPLSEGFIEGEEVECPWHGARFNIKTGAACCEPAEDGVACYAVRCEGDDLLLEL